MEETKLQLEAGKYYRTRGGEKAFVGTKAPFGSVHKSYVFLGHIEGREFCYSWAENGKYSVSKDGLDLVAEWVEPKRIKGKVLLWGNSEARFLPDGKRSYFDMSGCVASIEIDVLEGQGLEGGQ